MKNDNEIIIDGNRCLLKYKFNNSHEVVKVEFKYDVLEITLNILVTIAVAVLAGIMVEKIFGGIVISIADSK